MRSGSLHLLRSRHRRAEVDIEQEERAVSTRDWTTFHTQILAQERELIRLASDAWYLAGNAEALVSASNATRSVYEQVCDQLFKEMRQASAALAQLESRDPGTRTEWSLRVARTRLATIRELWQDAVVQLTEADKRHEAARQMQAQRKTAIAETLEAAMKPLRARAQEYASAVADELKAASERANEPTKAELHEIRRRIRQGDWSDLPRYQGTDTRTGSDCLHCGSSLPLDRKRFCSKRCHRIYVEANGTSARPRSRTTD